MSENFLGGLLGCATDAGLGGLGSATVLTSQGAQSLSLAHNQHQIYQAAQTQAVRDFRRVESMSDLDHAVFKTPIDTLVSLWIAKYGTDWVKRETVLGDEFFEWAALRLRSAGMLEEHNVWGVPGLSGPVLRIIDKSGG